MSRSEVLVFAALGASLSAPAAQAASSIFYQLQGGVLAHDVRLAGGRERGADLSAELQFVSPFPDRWAATLPAWLRFVTRPRPVIGGDLNTSGYTSQVYLGLDWTVIRIGNIFTPQDAFTFDYTFGPSFNDGYANTSDPDRKSLGSNVLFRLGGELGYEINNTTAVYLLYEHESNGGLAERNQSLNDLGLRIGFKF